MKYLLVSDIHGCLPALEKVLQFYDREHCDMLCILGDILNYGPRNSIPEGIDAKGIVEALNKRANNIVAVRGNCDAEVDQMLLDFPMMSDYLILVDEGRKIFLTHGHIYNKIHNAKRSFRCDCLWAYTSLGTHPAGGYACLQSRLYHFPKRWECGYLHDL